MKIRILLNMLLALGVVATLGSCRNDITDPVLTGEIQLTLLPSVEKMDEMKVRMRATGNSFFEDGDEITVRVTTSRTGNPSASYVYTYNGGTFEGGFYFRPDNTYITQLEALWPAEGSQGRMGIITDQRKYVDYKQANRLKAEANTLNIMPTDAPVPLLFTHEQSRITFRLAGQAANGLIIKELLLELKADLDGEGEKGVGFWAYCGDGTENPEEEGKGVLNARMILPAGIQLGQDINDGNRMKIGLVTVGKEGDDTDDYRGLIYIPNSTNITLEKNTDYLVTLTPEGYDLYATISVGGFDQSDGHVGIPFQLPVDTDDDDVYEINTVAQLVTISWLLDGDLNGELQSVWSDRNFNIPASIVVSAGVQAEGDRYLKASVLQTNKGKFSNPENATYSDGTLVFGK